MKTGYAIKDPDGHFWWLTAAPFRNETFRLFFECLPPDFAPELMREGETMRQCWRRFYNAGWRCQKVGAV